MCLCACVCALFSYTKSGASGTFFLCFHKHPVRLSTLLLIEALDLQLSYANYFNNLKIAVPTSAPSLDGEWTELEWAFRLRLVQ